jgi:hypothetical protein
VKKRNIKRVTKKPHQNLALFKVKEQYCTIKGAFFEDLKLENI